MGKRKHQKQSHDWIQIHPHFFYSLLEELQSCSILLYFSSSLTGFHGPTVSLHRFWTSSPEAPILPWWNGEGQRPTQAPTHWHHSCLGAQTPRGSTSQTGGQVLHLEVPVSSTKTRPWPLCFALRFYFWKFALEFLCQIFFSLWISLSFVGFPISPLSR